MAYPYVQAYHDYGPRSGPALACVIHHAEGGGTVGFLSRPNARGVSVHYVIEYSGRIVQMLREDHASGSINPNDLRTGDDPDGFYGRTAAAAVLGVWLRDPNAAVITVEVEGFARVGPNPAQAIALGKLARDVATRHPVRNLGHRDFQDVKACPGKLIPWADIGGHGDMAVPAAITDEAEKIVTVAAGTDWYDLDNKTVLGTGTALPLTARRSPYGVGSRRAIFGTIGGLRRTVLVQPATVVNPPTADCVAAVAAETKRVKLAAVVAIGGIK